MKAGVDYIGVGCGVLILNEKGEMLLMKRSSKSKNEAGMWSKPGGTVDYGEMVEAAAIREVKEELGVDVEVKFLAYYDHLLPEEKQHWVTFEFIGKIVSGEPKNMEPEKCDEIAWFSLDNLPDNLAQTVRERVEFYRKVVGVKNDSQGESND
ncbi:MAG: NUDIX domain-containing protein [bacterium]|nr:NUDIX domain-containing protein [bacterium]